MPEYSQYSQDTFYADDFIKFLDFQKLICKKCRLCKTDGFCSLSDELYPSHPGCLYNNLYEEINNAAYKLEDLIGCLRLHSPEDELTRLKADEKRHAKLKQIRKFAGA